MNQFNTIHGDEATETPKKWKRQPLAVHSTYRTSPPKTSSVGLAIMGEMNHRAIDNVDVEV